MSNRELYLTLFVWFWMTFFACMWAGTKSSQNAGATMILSILILTTWLLYRESR